MKHYIEVEERRVVLCGDLQRWGRGDPFWFFREHRRLSDEYHELLADPGVFLQVPDPGRDHLLVSKSMYPHGTSLFVFRGFFFSFSFP
jgi:hypothetical protein